MPKTSLQAVLEKLAQVDAKLDALLESHQRDAVADGREWLTVEQAAEICGYRPWTLRQACASGRLAAIDANAVRKIADGSWRIWWGVADSIRNNGLPRI